MDAEFRPRASVHYPRSAGELRSWFGTDADCLDYLEWLRWPYRDILADPQPKQVQPSPPGARGHPPSLDRPRADRPWRVADLH